MLLVEGGDIGWSIDQSDWAVEGARMCLFFGPFEWNSKSMSVILMGGEANNDRIMTESISFWA